MIRHRYPPKWTGTSAWGNDMFETVQSLFRLRVVGFDIIFSMMIDGHGVRHILQLLSVLMAPNTSIIGVAIP